LRLTRAWLAWLQKLTPAAGALIAGFADVSFWTFLKVGAIAMPVALLLSLGAAIPVQMLQTP
jgi:hypothetical protein